MKRNKKGKDKFWVPPEKPWELEGFDFQFKELIEEMQKYQTFAGPRAVPSLEDEKEKQCTREDLRDFLKNLDNRPPPPSYGEWVQVYETLMYKLDNAPSRREADYYFEQQEQWINRYTYFWDAYCRAGKQGGLFGS